ncbi:MAG: hypothetical protein M1835_006032 [Candelina submexicana]|nr:MAG: hypothetical protein M1835_006032 [Candelina submexicana]
MIPTDSFLHAHRKILSDTLSNTTAPTPPSSEAPPPAYTPPQPTNASLPTSTTFDPSSLYTDDDDDDDINLAPRAPITIKVNASTKIVGPGNYLASSSADTQMGGARMVAGILAALKQSGVIGTEGRARPVEISLNCGVSVAGCRNVVGGKVKEEREIVKTGMKRKAEEDDVSEEPKSKKVEVEGQA